MRRRYNPFRAFLAGVLLLVGALMVPVTLTSVWLRDTILDTDSFVSLYQPLSGKSTFQGFVSTQVADTATDVIQAGTSSAASTVDDFLGQFGVDLGVAEAAQGWTEQATEAVGSAIYAQTLPIVQSPQSTAAWTSALQQIHSQVVDGLEGAENSTLSLQAAPLVQLLREGLVERGYDAANLIPDLSSDVAIPLAQVQYSEQWQTAYSLLIDYGPWLPWVNAGIILVGFLLANLHSKSLARTALLVTVLCGGMWYALPRVGDRIITAADPEVAQILWQTGIAPLQESALWAGIGAAGIFLLAGAFHLVTRRS